METIWRWGVVTALVLAGGQGMARGAESRLLVSVEVAPGVDVAAADVRRAVATELGTAVIAARDSSADGATDVLLVALDPREIRMSLRAGAATIVSRAIAAPADRTGRLRSIGWLAGNLVRDQVGPIVATAEAPPALAADVPAAIAPAPLAPPAPVLPRPAAVSPAPAAVVASPPATVPVAIPRPLWAITVIGGPVATVIRDDGAAGTTVMRSGAFQLEVQRQPSPERMLLGLALTAGPDSPRHYLGLAAFAGEAWGGQSWFAEATLGLGVEALDGMAKTAMGTGEAYMTPTVTERWTSAGVFPGVYVRPAGTAGFRLSRFFDLVAQLGAHLSSNGSIASYLSSAAGVRLRLP
jgi:hypothetical protein